NDRYCKSSDWGDYNNDGLIDLFISNFAGENRLYKNFGNGLFKDIAREIGITDPYYSFTSWFWDYDNDGDLDIFSSGYENGIIKSIESFMGKVDSNYSLKLYENNGEGLYRDNTQSLGLLKVHSTMGANFGDVNNDGYDDLYLGTGYPAIDSFVPNAFYFNKEGLSFVDKTHIYGLGHIQKGHGVAFADYDLDGDLDIFEQMGGFYLSDGFTNILYQNSNITNNWIGIKLIGDKSGKIALGAKLNLVCDNKNYNNIVEPGGSFGSSSLIKVMGIQDCKNIDKLYITWPRDQSIQEINNIAVNQYILIKESELGYKKINFKVGNKIE
ncbi:MAG: CRTAC1 family protein, partial [SAR202 cluster bacterium]|nr:CRTAC1 family protein [SAR202 cluster bacterium]